MPRNQKDIETAQRICEELRSGNGEAILELYQNYQHFFIKFATSRLYDKNNTEYLVSNFWTELLNSNAICAYQGKNDASLRVYLSGILKWRIIDENRKHHRYTSTDIPPEKREDVQKRQRERLISEALLLLEKTSPKDTGVMRMRLKGMTYREMAEEELAGENPDQQTIQKKAEAIKKQFNRPLSGSLAKFSLMTKRLRNQYGWHYDDLLT